jgi:hypothetical protein
MKRQPNRLGLLQDPSCGKIERERETGCKRTRNNPASPGGETKQRERETRKEDYSVHNQELEIGKSNQRRMSSSGVNVDRLSRYNRLGLRFIECGDNCEMMMTNEPAAETEAGGGPLGQSRVIIISRPSHGKKGIIRAMDGSNERTREEAEKGMYCRYISERV